MGENNNARNATSAEALGVRTEAAIDTYQLTPRLLYMSTVNSGMTTVSDDLICYLIRTDTKNGAHHCTTSNHRRSVGQIRINEVVLLSARSRAIAYLAGEEGEHDTHAVWNNRDEGHNPGDCDGNACPGKPHQSSTECQQDNFKYSYGRTTAPIIAGGSRASGGR